MDRNNIGIKSKYKFLVKKRKLTYFFIIMLGIRPDIISGINKNLILDLIKELEETKFNILFFTDFHFEKDLNREYLYVLLWYKALFKKPKDLSSKFSIIKAKLDAIFGQRTEIFPSNKIKRMLIKRFEFLM